MIPKIIGLFLGISWIQTVYGAAYSQVYVQNGAEVVPVEYLSYGAPRVVKNEQIAAISAPPVGSALPLPNVVSPCVAPCVLPSQSVGTFAPVPNAKIIYNTPSVPTVIAPTNDEKSSYEYSYVVYDEDTGDRKAQRELSDGSVVQGEYSFIQPDGYVREVKYTADDLTGFNAVVKSFLPESVASKEKKKPEKKEKSEPPPCKETKSEALKVEPKHSHDEQPKLDHSEALQPTPESPHVEAHVELSVVPVEPAPSEHITEHADKAAHSGETPAEHAAELAPEYTPENGLQHALENPLEHAPERAPENEPDNVSKHASESHSEHLEITVETPAEHAKHSPHQAEVAQLTIPADPTHVEMEHHAEPIAQPSTVELIQAPANEDCDQKTHAAVQAPKPQVSIPNGLATYSDILRCIQAAMANKDANASNISPLTYIILPGTNKPC